MSRVLARIKKALVNGFRKRLAPILPVLFAALLLSILVTGLFRATDLVEHVPEVMLPATERTITPTGVVFFSTLLASLVIGGCLFLYWRHRERVHGYWQRYSTWAQAMIVGCVCAVVTAVVLGCVVFAGWIPPYVAVLGFLVAWPLSAGSMLLHDRRSFGASTVSSVKTGYIHTKGLESRTLSVIVGFLVAVLVGLTIWYVGTWYFEYVSLRLTAITTVLLWGAVTLLVYNRYETSTRERTDIAIVAVKSPESRPTRELTIKNESSTSIDLSQSRIRDTEFDLYRLGVDVTLKPGAVCTFEIPESFSLEPNRDSIELPLGYTLKRGGETPTLFTKTGEKFSLQQRWSADESETARTPVSGADHGLTRSSGSSGEPSSQD